MLEKYSKWLTLVLVAWLPFEFRESPVMSNLQWVFVIVLLAGLPVLFRCRKKLIHDRFVQLAIIFALTQWIAAAFAGEHMMNSVKAAMRISVGVSLFAIVWAQQDRENVFKCWAGASIVAALYGLADYAGMGAVGLFREGEFYLGEYLRLSGSFEYPTTAAGFYAMSIPMVVMAPIALPIRVFGGLVLLAALIFTYSRGASVAVGIVLLVGVGLTNRSTAVKLALAGIACFTIAGIFQPMLIRYSDGKAESPLAADYVLQFNTIHQQPRVLDFMPVTVKNTGLQTWPANGESQVFLSYHWYNTARKRILRERPIETPMPRDVKSGEAVKLIANFITPNESGLYLLDWDLKRKNGGWFSIEHNVTPAIVEAQIEEDVVAWKKNGDVSQWHGKALGEMNAIDATISRTELWTAAMGLIRRSPLIGWGPDNFRLLYGRELKADLWDANVRSNNLDFELLVGSGLLGLATFMSMLFFVRWTPGAASMSVAVFLVHGLVDVLLMTTSIYFGFWILIGLAHENRV